jgi:hypothetical protein
MGKYYQVGGVYPCKIMDKDGNVKEIIYPKDMDLSYRESISMQYNKYHRKGTKKPPTILPNTTEKEGVNT